MDSKANSRPAHEGEASDNREIVITRMIDAPRTAVFNAWTDPRHIGEWWGPDGFTNTVHEMDARAGGVWRFVMHGPDGTDYDNQVDYREVVAPERLVYLHGSGVPDDPMAFNVWVTFDDVDGRTKLTMRSRFASVDAVRIVKEFGAVELGGQTLARCEAFLKATRGDMMP